MRKSERKLFCDKVVRSLKMNAYSTFVAQPIIYMGMSVRVYVVSFVLQPKSEYCRDVSAR